MDLKLCRQAVGFQELELIFQHTQLTRLVLEQAGLRRLPPALSALAQLRRLSVAHNAGLAKGFAHLSRLSSLTALDLSFTGLQGEGRIPPSLAHMPQLRELRLAGNLLRSGWEHLEGLSQLSVLEMQGWHSHEDRALADQLPAVLSRLAGLRRVDVGSNPQVASGWQHLPTGLTSLDLYAAGQLREMPAAIGRMPRLASLEVGFWRQLATGAGALALLPPSLTHLCLSDCHLRAVPPDLALLTGLQSLDLRSNPCFATDDVMAAGWEHLPSARLTALSLFSCKLPDVPQQLAGCTALRSLNLGRCTLKSTRNWPALAPLSQLTHLNLESTSLPALPESLSCLASLADLNVSENELLGSGGGWEHLSALPLTHLDIGNCGLQRLPAPIAALTDLRE